MRSTGRRTLSSLLSICVVLAAAECVGPAAAAAASRALHSDDEEALATALCLQDAFAAVAERAFPSVVAITSYVREESTAAAATSPADASNQWRSANKRGTYPGFRKLHSGSGVLFEEKTHVITLCRLVTLASGKPADIVDVETHDGQHYMSRVMGVEPTLDIAVLELVALPQRLPLRLEPAAVGDSDSLRIGHWVFALGDPPGPPQVFAAGILSTRPERRCYQEQRSATCMQAALRVHPEAYGGPLVDLRGEVVGLLVPDSMAATAHAGFASVLPIDIVRPIYAGIRANQGFRSPWIGFSVLEITDLPERLPDSSSDALLLPRYGVYIDDVYDPSPASRVDIRAGDFLLTFNGRKLFSVYQFQEQLHLTGAGRAARLEIFRNGETRFEALTVEERPAAATPH